jgi:hypothetical protein
MITWFPLDAPLGDEKETGVCHRSHLALIHPTPLYQHLTLLANAGECKIREVSRKDWVDE